MAEPDWRHCACVLLRHPLPPAELDELVARWAGPEQGLDHRPVLDQVPARWPDSADDALGAEAWRQGELGRWAFPGALHRAVEQCWAWDGGPAASQQHQAFLRLRLPEPPGGAAASPADLPALAALAVLARRLLDLPDALGYFQPAGEVLLHQAGLAARLDFAASRRLPPLDVLGNVRVRQLDETWALMDTVGNEQFGRADVEAVFRADAFSPPQIDLFLRHATLLLLEDGVRIADGDTIDGVGTEVWQARNFDTSALAPARRTLAFWPLDGDQPPAHLLVRAAP